MSPRRIMRSAVILQTPMISAAASSVISPRLGAFAVAVNCNVVVIAETAHALLHPSVAVARRLAATIEEACDLPIRHQPRQLAHERYRIIGRPMVSATCIEPLLDLQCGVVYRVLTEGANGVVEFGAAWKRRQLM